MGTIRKQYSANYQVVELTEDYTDFNDVEVISARMDSVAGKELESMCKIAKNIAGDTTSTTATKSAPQQANGLATPNQKKYIKNNWDKCQMIAEKLGYKLDETLTGKEAGEILSELFAKKQSNTGF